MGKKQNNDTSAMDMNSKMKKKMKITQKKLIINNDHLTKSINYFKNDSSNQKANVYLFLILKSEITDNDSLKHFKNKLIPLKYPIPKKTCIIDEDLTQKDKEQFLTIDNQLKICSNDEIKLKIHQLKNNEFPINQLNYIYSVFLSNIKYTNHLKQYDNDIDVCFYQKKKDKEVLENMVTEMHKGASLLKKVKNGRIFKIKCAGIEMTMRNIQENIHNMIYKATSYLLTYSQKHNGIEAIVVKTENSIPLTIHGNIPAEFIDYIN